MMKISLVIAIAWLALARGQNNPFSINSPRSSNPAEEAQGKKAVLVKLPDDLEAVLKAQKADRSQIHASILGLPPSENIDAILSGTTTTTKPATKRVVTTTKRPTTTITKKIPTSSPSATTAKTTTNRYNDDIGVKMDEKEQKSGFWQLAWEAHVYFSGTLFVLLSIYCTVNIMRIHTFSRLFRRGYFIALNLCLIFIGILRPIYLFYDPYNYSGAWPRMASYLLLDTGFPCVTTAFAVLFLALLRATQIELVSPGFQRPRSLGIFCAIHFAVSISIDVAVGVKPEVRYAILICQGFFIVWSLLLSAGYFYVYSAMRK